MILPHPNNPLKWLTLIACSVGMLLIFSFLPTPSNSLEQLIGVAFSVTTPLFFLFLYKTRDTWLKKPSTQQTNKTGQTVIQDVSQVKQNTPQQTTSLDTQPQEVPTGLKDMPPPGGGMEADSPFYIHRGIEKKVLENVHRHRAMVVLYGPHQSGKTSLINSVSTTLQKNDSGMRIVYVDFQGLEGSQFESSNLLWQAIVEAITDQLDLKTQQQDQWQNDFGLQKNLDRFLGQFVFNEQESPLLLCLDEVDRVFKSPVKLEFFSMVRSFWNRGARDKNWQSVRWLLGSSSEPSFFIQDIHESPFNVGMEIHLQPFSKEEVAEFSNRFGLTTPNLDWIMDTLGGHPYLVHLLFYHMALHPESAPLNLDINQVSQGIFRSHLERYQRHFNQDKDLKTAMQLVISGSDDPDPSLADRLMAEGLTRRDQKGKITPSCQLYRKYFDYLI